MPDAGVLATVMLLVGLFLLGLEFFVPSFGMILVVAIVSLIVSFWSAYKAWWGISPWFFWTYVVLLTVGIPGSLMGAIALIQNTRFGNRMILAPGPGTSLPPSPLERLIGQLGVSHTLMMPGGIVIIDGERHHAESIGMLIEPNTSVIVVNAKGNRLVVRPATAADSELASEAAAAHQCSSRQEALQELSQDAPPVPDPLDFDIPEDYTRKS